MVATRAYALGASPEACRNCRKGDRQRPGGEAALMTSMPPGGTCCNNYLAQGGLFKAIAPAVRRIEVDWVAELL
jgi:hypothetical protein